MPSSSKDGQTSRTWSLRRNKETIKLTSEQKKRSKMTSSVDPTRAITEEEPFQVNQAKSTTNIRSIQFKDQYGNPITDPDWSNPTRPRWERPLDTIRSFQDAIYKESSRQSSYYVVDTVDTMDNSWRNSYHHQAGPYEPSVYHRNNGAQRYAPANVLYHTNRYAKSATPSGSNYGESDVGYGNMNVRSPPLNEHMAPQQGPHYPPSGTRYSPGPGGAGKSPSGGRRHDTGFRSFGSSGSNGSSGEGSSHSYTSRSNGGESGVDPYSEVSSFGSSGNFRDPDSPQYQQNPYELRPGQQGVDSSPSMNRPAAPFSPPSSSGNGYTQQVSNSPMTEAPRKPIALNSGPSPPATPPQPEKRKSWFKRKMSKG